MAKANLTGQTFGRWAVLEQVVPSGGRTRWRCQCECGVQKVVSGSALVCGKSKSCGCLHKDLMVGRLTTHGASKSPEYVVWINMRKRCLDPSDRKYADYGGRGIRVYDEWIGSFSAFLLHVGKRPSPSHSIDRINNDGNYEPGNVRWSTVYEQALNQRLRRTNKSGAVGVRFDQRRGKWIAEARRVGKTVFCREFNSYDEAVTERCKALVAGGYEVNVTLPARSPADIQFASLPRSGLVGDREHLLETPQ